MIRYDTASGFLIVVLTEGPHQASVHRRLGITLTVKNLNLQLWPRARLPSRGVFSTETYRTSTLVARSTLEL